MKIAAPEAGHKPQAPHPPPSSQGSAHQPVTSLDLGHPTARSAGARADALQGASLLLEPRFSHADSEPSAQDAQDFWKFGLLQA